MLKLRQKELNVHLLFISFLLLNMSNFSKSIIFLKEYLLLFKVVSYLFFGGIAFINCLYFYKRGTKLSTLIYTFLFFTGGCITYFISKDVIFLEMLLIVLACSRTPFIKLVYIDFLSKTLILIMNFICDTLGLVSGMIISTRDNFIRSSFGFHYPNTFGMITMIILFELYILFPDKKKIILPISLALTIINDRYADSRASVGCMLLFLILYLFTIFHRNFLELKLIKLILKNSFLILLLFSILITMLYSTLGGTVVHFINNWTSTRLSIQSMYWNVYDITIFGNDIFFIRSLDNGYIKLLLKFGLCMTVLYSIVFYKMFAFLYKQREYCLVICLFCFTVYTLFESYSLYIYSNIFLLGFITEVKIR